MFQDDTIDSVYSEEDRPDIAYASFMDKSKPQKFNIDFSSAQIVNDKYNNQNSNIQFLIFPISISLKGTTYNSKKPMQLIAPKLSFARMFKEHKIDIRQLINTSKKAYLEIFRYSQKNYTIKQYKQI